MVDIIILVYHPDNKLRLLINQLAVQTIQPKHIYFIMTSAGAKSDERLTKILQSVENSTTVVVQKEEFDHGGTRALGASVSDAEYMLFMTQDAVPYDENMIDNLLKAMQDNSIAIAYARQLAGDKAGVIERFTRNFNYPDVSMTKSKENLESLGIKTYFCSNACALYRKSKYEELGGFVAKTIFNEDMIYAAKVIEAGYKIAYAAEAKIIHTHHYTYRQQFSRNFDLAVSQRQYRAVFEKVKSESEGIKMVRETAKYLLSIKKPYLLPDLFFQSAFKLLGYKAGLHYEILPGCLIRKFSMNKSYWSKNPV
jgi:rhamnosyltransferase